MSRTILHYPSPTLLVRSEPVREIDSSIRELATEMIRLMQEARGIGIAAPQVGERKRMIVIGGRVPTVYLNPQIVSSSPEMVLGPEGCLSLPGAHADVLRHLEIEVEAVHLDGGRVRLLARDLVARIFQHEIDHLDGIMFFDRLDEGERELVVRNLREGTEGARSGTAS